VLEKLLEIEAHGGFYVGRIRKNMSPVFEAVHRGIRTGALGKRIHEVLGGSRGGEVDADVRIEFQDRSSGKTGKRFHRDRLVGVREGGAFRMWITNLTREQATVSEVAALSVARWELEIFFRELKTIWRADQIPTSDESATRCLLYASMLAVLFSRALRHHLFDRYVRERVPLERWARLVRSLLSELTALMTSCAARRPRGSAAHARGVGRGALKTPPKAPTRTRMGAVSNHGSAVQVLKPLSRCTSRRCVTP
jgi:hypothetical protein